MSRLGWGKVHCSSLVSGHITASRKLSMSRGNLRCKRAHTVPGGGVRRTYIKKKKDNPMSIPYIATKVGKFDLKTLKTNQIKMTIE